MQIIGYTGVKALSSNREKKNYINLLNSKLSQ